MKLQNISLLVLNTLIITQDISSVNAACKQLEKEYKKPDYTDWEGHNPEVINKANFLRAIYSDCGVTKKCIAPEPDEAEKCTKGNTCYMAATIGDTNSTSDPDLDEKTQIVVELLGLAPSWIAIAFAPDKTTKNGAYQVECVKDATGPKVRLFESYYDLKTEQNIRDTTSEPFAKLIDIQSVEINGVLYCKFYIKKTFTYVDKGTKLEYKYDFNNERYKPLFARGSEYDAGKPSFNPACTDFPKWNKDTVDFSSRLGPNFEERTYLLSHAYCMIVAFMVIIPIGGFYTRYFKAMFPFDSSFMELPIWLWVHVICEGVALITIFAGLQYSASARSGKWTKEPYEWTMHGQLGLLVCSIRLAFYLFFFIFRTKTVKPIRWKLRLVIHQLFGHANYITVLYILYFTHYLPFTGLNCASIIVIRVWMIFYFFMHIILSMYFTWVHDLLRFERFGFEIHLTNELSLFNTIFQPNYQVNNQPLRLFRAGLFLVFCLVILILSAVIMFSLDNNNEVISSCRYPFINFG